MITKGAVEEIFNICTKVEVKGEVLERLPDYDARRKALVDQLNSEGFRVIGLAYKQLPTSGKTTYAASRFLYANAPKEDGTVVLDFNKAENPPCAFTPSATCPLPPAQNRLSVSISAGEQRYQD